MDQRVNTPALVPRAGRHALAPVTVVIPTLNEVDRLPACLASVQWAESIIVADAGSTDGTVALARAWGAQVIHCVGQSIGAQKNAAIALATTPWVLSIDADERVLPALRDAIVVAVRRPTADAYRIQLRNRYLGAPYERGSWGRDWHVRLYRPSCRWTEQRVHERLLVSGSVGTLDGRLEHESYRDLLHQLEKCHRYAAWGADDQRTAQRRISLRQLAGRPLWKFVKLWALQGMWREGTRGFVFAAVHAWGCFAKYALIWDRQRRERAAEPTASVDSAVRDAARTAVPERIAVEPAFDSAHS
jgi:glycosyltransferase involved in cell wall biosynthesis